MISAPDTDEKLAKTPPGQNTSTAEATETNIWKVLFYTHGGFDGVPRVLHTQYWSGSLEIVEQASLSRIRTPIFGAAIFEFGADIPLLVCDTRKQPGKMLPCLDNIDVDAEE